ncbi:hypothetical protein LXH13_25540 [Streptomyces spinosirectus]|uniref:hypothetical protein n=1 Tax=Streptomyces TaxID=1883 RepID=UPI001C9E1CB4|nr:MULTISPECIES: hypothetical protein [Streptomyces]MBY8344802.1 hypothetical protein [Streptomyces plumbidurans]UIR20188.1 hypothetical protein LXH13_25540 [Streptomyces spinosirectus]
MQSPTHPTAWDHPPTRNAWMRHMAMNVVGLIGWPGVWVALICVSTYTPNWVVWIFMPYFIYGLYRFCGQFTHFPQAFRMLRVLQEYPWQFLEGVPSGLGKHPKARDDGMWFEFWNPADAEEKIPLVFIRHQRSYWWLKRLDGPRTRPSRRAQIEPLWFAGDPRFLAVVAAPGRGGKAPKRLHFLYQRPAVDIQCAPDSWDATPTDLEHARRAGARVDMPSSTAAVDEVADQGAQRLPWASQPALKHPPTDRAIRRRVIRQMVLLFAVWPALVLIPLLLAAGGDDRFIPIMVRVIVLVPIVVPLHIWALVTALRMHRVLSTHSWRLVECEVVRSAAHGWRLKDRSASGREIRVPAILRLHGHGTVLTAVPFKRYVSPRITHLWCAGPPGVGAVVSEPGGARPFRLAKYKGAIGAATTAPVTGERAQVLEP